jgi:hypothetical protein
MSEKGERNAKREVEEDHQDVLVASVGRRGAGEDENQPTREAKCRPPSLIQPRPASARASQFVRVWPLYPDCCFRLPFYQNGTSSFLESICSEIHTDIQMPFTLAN